MIGPLYICVYCLYVYRKTRGAVSEVWIYNISFRKITGSTRLPMYKTNIVNQALYLYSSFSLILTLPQGREIYISLFFYFLTWGRWASSPEVHLYTMDSIHWTSSAPIHSYPLNKYTRTNFSINSSPYIYVYMYELFLCTCNYTTWLDHFLFHVLWNIY